MTITRVVFLCCVWLLSAYLCVRAYLTQSAEVIFFFYSLCRFVSWQILSDIVLISAVPLRSAWFHTNLFSRNLLAAQGTGV